MRYRHFQYIGELCRYLLAVEPSPLDHQNELRLAIGNGLRPDIWENVRAITVRLTPSAHVCDFACMPPARTTVPEAVQHHVHLRVLRRHRGYASTLGQLGGFGPVRAPGVGNKEPRNMGGRTPDQIFRPDPVPSDVRNLMPWAAGNILLFNMVDQAGLGRGAIGRMGYLMRYGPRTFLHLLFCHPCSRTKTVRLCVDDWQQHHACTHCQV